MRINDSSLLCGTWGSLLDIDAALNFIHENTQVFRMRTEHFNTVPSVVLRSPWRRQRGEGPGVVRHPSDAGSLPPARRWQLPAITEADRASCPEAAPCCLHQLRQENLQKEQVKFPVSATAYQDWTGSLTLIWAHLGPYYLSLTPQIFDLRETYVP